MTCFFWTADGKGLKRAQEKKEHETEKKSMITGFTERQSDRGKKSSNHGLSCVSRVPYLAEHHLVLIKDFPQPWQMNTGLPPVRRASLFPGFSVKQGTPRKGTANKKSRNRPTKPEATEGWWKSGVARVWQEAMWSEGQASSRCVQEGRLIVAVNKRWVATWTINKQTVDLATDVLFRSF